ncbi:hypothetical protein IM697_38510 [Streptomyces ferrugineus]|uniref:Uncharacterized protein n=1 Tax=Streptomyces ferrugineus TaxID=1413221 RepID=A0A7M2SK83_9ACTN|nr:hypothetical protein [Streptomyces ferrugineus]QOV35873.1 hypothetical protein IM697_38510 [Streptomyces ferrugineus]
MRSRFTDDDAEQAAQLLAFAMRPRLLPSRDNAYRELLRRYRHDGAFRTLTGRIAAGLGLRVLGEHEDIGLAIAADGSSPFETRMETYARRTQKEGGYAERFLHGIIHLAVAAVSFPRPDDLAKDEYVGRVSVDVVDAVVREACDRLREKAASREESADVPSDAPELELAWHAYANRPETFPTKDKRRAMNTTKGMVSRALNFLAEQGFLTPVKNAGEDVFQTTRRYQLQVRELAATSAFEELVALGVVPPMAVTTGPGTVAEAPEDV